MSPATAKGDVSSLQCVLSSPSLRQKLVFSLIAEAFCPALAPEADGFH